MYIETWLNQDTLRPVTVNRLRGTLFSADVQANKVGVTLTTDGDPAEITDGCTGYFIRNDGYTILIDGAVEGNKIYVVLPAECYAVIGQFSLVIKTGTTTVAACTGYIYRSRTDEIVDPGDTIPSIEELMAKLARLDNYSFEAEAWAKGTRNGESVEDDDPAYHNNAKYYAERAGEAAEEAVESAISDLNRHLLLQEEQIPDTVQTITFDSGGNVQSITHTANNVAVRTDVFTFGTDTITEVRTLSTGESLTIVTNTETLVTTTTYAEA